MVFIVIFNVFMFYNLGNILDVTTLAKKSNIIVCLGGGDGARIKKAYSLYENGFSTSNLLVLTGDNRTKKRIELGMDEKRVKYLKKYHFEMKNLVHYKLRGNTRVEMQYIKNFMNKNNFTSAIIVSDTPHSRRIRMLLNLATDNTGNLNFYIVSSEAPWWNTKYYYLNKKAKVFAWRESIKLIKVYVSFGILNKIGLYDIVRTTMMPSYKYVKKRIDRITYFYLKSTS